MWTTSTFLVEDIPEKSNLFSFNEIVLKMNKTHLLWGL